MIAKNNVLIKGNDSIAFSIYRSKNEALIAFFVNHKLDEEVIVDLTQVNQYWVNAFNDGYEVAF